MSGSTLSCSANRPPAGSGVTGGQEINSLAAAAVASTVANPGPATADTPTSTTNQHIDPPTPAQLMQLSSDQSSKTFASDVKPCSQKAGNDSFNSDSTAEAAVADAAEAAITPDHTPVDPATASTAQICDPAASSDPENLESSLLLKPFSGMTGNTKPDT
ncbi:hypothetical protein LPJ74_001695, partial [Coemansia sp. RSA 1843]